MSRSWRTRNNTSVILNLFQDLIKETSDVILNLFQDLKEMPKQVRHDRLGDVMTSGILMNGRTKNNEQCTAEN